MGDRNSDAADCRDETLVRAGQDGAPRTGDQRHPGHRWCPGGAPHELNVQGAWEWK